MLTRTLNEGAGEMSGPVGVPEPGIGIIDELATALMDQWAESEPEHSITKNPVSYVATFVELARAAHLIVAPRVRAEREAEIAALIRKNAATLDSFAREGSTAGLIAYLIDNVMAAGDAVPVATPEPSREQLARWIGNTVDPAQSGVEVRRQCIEVVRSGQPIPPTVATPTEPGHQPAGDPMTGPTFCTLDGAQWTDAGCSAEQDGQR